MTSMPPRRGPTPHRGRTWYRLDGVVSAAGVASLLCGAVGALPDSGPPAVQEADPADLTLRVTAVMDDLDLAWDTAFLPNGAMLVTERDRRRILLRLPDGDRRVVADSAPGLWASGETGLMSIAVDPGFRRNRRFYTCHGAVTDVGHDVRVVAWRLNASSTRAFRTEALVTGIPATTGRHGGCRLELDGSGRLYIGTGDATLGRNPQRLTSLGGKVLRVNRFSGGAAAGNPYADAADPSQRIVLTHGHRNVQGLALRPGGGMWSVEHGTYRDDEVNRLVAGGDYGWDPGPDYDESRPMTDFSLPGRQRGARWRSGDPTVATSGADWLADPRWGPWRGRLAVAALKDASLRVMEFDGQGRLVSVRRPAALTRYGRLRSVTQGPDGALYVTTSNGGGGDVVLRVVPE
ncbi:MAG: PQQ-dependent sugar dehydrogenase [Actinomycetota bacterium]|nr:PQQ-dependent sugar dehydrogenase [Actinomycetota bacterium]